VAALNKAERQREKKRFMVEQVYWLPCNKADRQSERAFYGRASLLAALNKAERQRERAFYGRASLLPALNKAERQREREREKAFMVEQVYWLP